MKVKIAQSVDEKAWDALVAEASGGHLFQSAAWAALQREYFGVKNYFFTVESPAGSKPLALLRADRESPLNRWLFEKPLSSATVPLADRLTAEVSVKYGPLYLGSPGRQDKARMFSLLLDSLENYCRSQGVVSLKGAFGSIYGAEEEDHDHSEIRETLQAGGYRATKAATFLVDLRPDEDKLWRNLKQSARKAVRHGREQGIKIERMESASGLEAYHDFVCRCRSSLGLRSTSLRNLTEMWRILRPAGMLEIFLASRQGELLGGMGVWQHAGVMVEWGSVQSERARVEKLYCSDLLKWEVIRWGHGRGHRLYDLAGVEPDLDRADPKKRGIYQFKAKWGGSYRESEVFFKPLKPLRHKILKMSAGLARKLLG